MTSPTTTTAALSRNGTRQPQLSNCSAGSEENPRNASVASIDPAAAPWLTQLA